MRKEVIDRVPSERTLSSRIKIEGKMPKAYEDILSEEAVNFLIALHDNFNSRRKILLTERVKRQSEIDEGIFPKFLEETKWIRESDWVAATLPDELSDRRVEITGPVDRKMIINALNSGANVFMADFEDSTSPTWQNIIEGQINIKDAVNNNITYDDPASMKHYELNEKTALLMVRPRGWHLNEKHFLIDGAAISGSLLDFGLFFFHNAKTLINSGAGPYFYLPKLENHLEARLWNHVFNYSQDYLHIPRGTIKATVLIENILAAFEMDEILFQLKEHAAGLNCGRWDYIFSFIKKFRNHPQFILPDRSQVTMTTHFLHSYSKLLIKTCHKRNVHAIGGMAAQIPIKEDIDANNKAIEMVKEDKLREVKDGHDGTWVAHPGLVKTAKNIFDEYMQGPNQISDKKYEAYISPDDLLDIPNGDISFEGLRNNINISIRYLKSWLEGKGCVPINHLMEDAATAEISRTQVWQWIHNQNGKISQTGKKIDTKLVDDLINAEVSKIAKEDSVNSGSQSVLETAADIFREVTLNENYCGFFTETAYKYL